MMLPVTAITPLRIPPGIFTSGGTAPLFLLGGLRKSGWTVRACVTAGGSPLGKLKSLAEIRVPGGPAEAQQEAGAPYPDLVAEAAFAWFAAQARGQGLRVVSVECFNHLYAPEERPRCCLCQVIVANGAFTPQPGVTYPDEMSPHQVAALLRNPRAPGHDKWPDTPYARLARAVLRSPDGGRESGS